MDAQFSESDGSTDIIPASIRSMEIEHLELKDLKLYAHNHQYEKSANVSDSVNSSLDNSSIALPHHSTPKTTGSRQDKAGVAGIDQGMPETDGIGHVEQEIAVVEVNVQGGSEAEQSMREMVGCEKAYDMTVERVMVTPNKKLGTSAQTKKAKSAKRNDVKTKRTGQALYDAINKRGSTLITQARSYYSVTGMPVNLVLKPRTNRGDERTYKSPNFDVFQPKQSLKNSTKKHMLPENDDVKDAAEETTDDTLAYDMTVERVMVSNTEQKVRNVSSNEK